MASRYHIKKGDLVIITSGKEKGKSGSVLRIFPKKDRATIEKLNFVKRHTKPTQSAPQGGIIEKEASIHISNLMLYCDRCSKGTRPKKKALSDGKMVKVCRHCGEMLEKEAS